MHTLASYAAIPPTSTFFAPRAMVATTDHLASSAAILMLSRGGSAADGAVAAATVLAVTSPHACGLGGDLFALVQTPGAAPQSLIAAGRSGSGADPEVLRREGLREMPMRDDIRSATVPGAMDGWLALHGRYGRLPLEDVLAPAIAYADNGFPMSSILAGAFSELGDAAVPAEFATVTPRPGAILRRPGLAATLRNVSRDGRDAFYGGAFGEGLITLGRGWFTDDDLATISTRWQTALQIRAWDTDIWTVGAPSQGYITLLGAAIAAGLDLPSDVEDPLWPHLLVEATVVASYDRPAYLHAGADTASLLREEEVIRRRALISHDRPSGVGLDVMNGDTTQLCVVDENRMAVSLMQSNAAGFGTKVFEPATGIEVHNRGVGFSLIPGDVAELAPGIVPPHTLSPALATRPDGRLRAVLGSAGGDAQPHVVLQFLARLLVNGQQPAETIGGGRFRLGARNGNGFDTWKRPDGRSVLLEQGAPRAWREGLIARGHEVHEMPVREAYAGHGHLIELTDDDVLAGTCEPRAVTGSIAGL